MSPPSRRLSFPDFRDADLRRRQAEAVQHCGIPLKDLELLRAGSAEVTPALEALEAFDPATSTLILSGPAGVGKTFAGSTWLYRLVMDPANWTERLCPELERHGLFLRATQLARWSRYEQKSMHRLLNVSRLVVDDVGSEFMDAAGSFMCLFDELVDARYADRKQIIITTNLDADQFHERYGERVIDRVRESGRFISLTGRSLRGKRGGVP